MATEPTPTPAAAPSSKVSDTILKRVYLLFGAIVLFALLIIGQTLRIQWGQGDRWRQVAARERVITKPVVADRGSILADDGTILAITLPFYRVAIDATVLRESDYPSLPDTIDLLSKRLAAQLGRGQVTSAELRTRILRALRRRDRHVYLFPVSRTFTYPEMKLIQSLPILNRGRFKGGLIVEKVLHKRFYPFQDMARITLGVVRDDSIPSKGLEVSFNHLLKGRDGMMLVQRLPGGIEVPLSEIGEVDPQDGYDLHTTLNVHLQDVVSSALRRTVERTEAKGGVAILMEVQTGHIKAVANYPEDFNAAIATQTEPGSTFKLAATIAALEAGAVRPTDTIATGRGEVKYYDRTVRDVYPLGNISFQTAFEKSSNVALSKVIQRGFGHRPKEFIAALDRMGALSMVGSQLRGEPVPYAIRPEDKKQWSGTTLPLMATGYNVLLTPLQQLAFYNAVANGGRMIQPILVQEARSASEVAARFEPVVIREHICSDQTLETVRKLLEGVVEHGTAANIKNSAYRIAGKTGTAKKSVNGAYQKVYRASFAGYFPAEAPRYSCIVIIDEPSTGEYYGAQVAAPVFKEIADNLYATDRSRWAVAGQAAPLPEVKEPRLPITRRVHFDDAEAVYNTLNIASPTRPSTEYVASWQSGATVQMASYTVPKGRVPDVTHMSARDALPLLENLGLRVRLQGNGKVRQQSIAPGQPLRKGSLIVLTLS